MADCDALTTPFSDPQFGCQWHLRNQGQRGGVSGEDIRVETVWSGGNLGAGIAVAIVDGVVSAFHPDLSENYDIEHSPRESGLTAPWNHVFLVAHATAVAGLVAARDNDVGGRGVAPRATLYGFHLLWHLTAENTVAAMTQELATVAVSNNSWGNTDGPYVDPASAGWEMAIDTGVTTGYGGKGAVYVWAAGNGGDENDNSNFDGFANYYGVVAVCAVTDGGSRAEYSEEGANLWICAPSDGGTAGIYTTGTSDGYVDDFGGTSAAAPIASGVVALMRASKSDLTWRDVKLILAGSARKNDSSNSGWLVGAQRYGGPGNYNFNHEYGFGVVDAKAAVDLAADWELLPAFVETAAVEATPNLSIPDASDTDSGATQTSTVTVGTTVEFIEFVEVIADFDATSFRDLKVELVSPSNAVSTLATSYVDGNGQVYGIDADYRFGSARHLGENPAGTWTLRVTDEVEGNTATLKSWSLKIYGHVARLAAPAISLVDRGQRSLTVSWSAPASVEASAITSYDVRTIRSAAPDKASNRWSVVDPAWTAGALSYTVTGLLDLTGYDVQVRAVNVGGDGSWSSRVMQETLPNQAPSAVGSLTAAELHVNDGNEVMEVADAFEDPEDDTLTYAASSSAPAVVQASVSGSRVTITPLARGNATITVTATDIAGSNIPAMQEFEVTVVNRPPVAVGTLPALSLRVEDGDRAVDASGAFSDPDADDLNFAATSSDETAATVAAAGSVVTVAPLSRGTTTIGVTATDVEGELATQEFEVTVANRPPEAVGTVPALTLRVEDGDEPVDVSDAFKDPDDDDLTYAATSSNEAAATVAAAGSVVTVTPVSGGRTNVTVTATDEENGSATQEFEVTVVNRAPQAVGSLVGPGLQVGDGNQSMDIVDAFEDLDEDRLTYSASSSAPAVAQASVSGSRVTLRPVGRGTATITVAATDIAGSNTPATQTFDVQVKARRGVSVSTDALTVNEGTTAAYTVVLDSEPTGQVVVTPSVVSSTEVTVDPLSLTFDEVDWATPKTVTVEGAQDQDAVSEPPVTIRHQVSGSDYGPVTAASVRVTVVEDDAPTLSVEASESVEDGGSLTFEVTLSLESSSEVTVDYATSDGSGAAGARAGLDYTASSGTLTFPANSTASRQIVVDITDDGEDEEEEELFRLTLENPQNASLAGGGSTLQVVGTIHDDDDPEVEVSFGSSGYGVTEGRTVDVVVQLDRDPERDLEIFLERTHHGGAAEADYSGVPQSVTFGPGVRRQEFQVAATDDAADDDGESVVLSFVSLPPRVTGDDETTVAINDNDASPSSPVGGGGGGGGGGGPAPGDDEEDDEEDDAGGGGSGGGGSGGGGGAGGGGGPPRAAIGMDAECADSLCRARTGVPVSFEDASTGSVSSRRWEFGDGRQTRRRTVSHAWSSPGFYEVTLTVSDGTTTSIESRVFLVAASNPAGNCETDAETLCLQDSRYAVGVDWWTAGGASGAASVVRSGTNDSGLFWFFDRENWEILIKVLDGCAVNGHVWVFGASTTDLGYAIRVTDTVTGAVKEYRNEPGLPASAITDGTAFPESCRR